MYYQITEIHQGVIIMTNRKGFESVVFWLAIASAMLAEGVITRILL